MKRLRVSFTVNLDEASDELMNDLMDFSDHLDYDGLTSVETNAFNTVLMGENE